MSHLYPENYERIQAEIALVLGNTNKKPLSQEGRSRDRLLRVRKAIAHVLCDVFPKINDAQKQELYYWLDAINRISEAEATDVIEEGDA